MRKLCSIFLLFLTCSISLYAQEEDVYHQPEFKILAPDTVSVGTAFKMVYEVTASGWDAVQLQSNPSFLLQQQKHKVKDLGDGRVGMTMNVSWLPQKPGLQTVPYMEAQNGRDIYRSPDKSIYVLPDAAYQREYLLAIDWLRQHGLSADIQPEVELLTEDLVIFTDRINSCFALVANHKYWNLLKNPVLGYSIENIFTWGNNSSDGTTPVLSRYTTMLRNMQSVCHGLEHSGEVKPLLGHNNWGQYAPFNDACPKVGSERAPVGCVAIAMGQIMRYYAWPKKPEISWLGMKHSYPRGEVGTAPQAATLLHSLGLMVDADYSKTNTMGDVLKVIPTLTTKMQYDSRIRLLQNLPAGELLPILYSELDAGRPCYVSNGAHSFVIDGCQDEYMHVNWGWHGHCNGYYRLALWPEAVFPKHELQITIAIVGIQPRKDVEHTIQLETPGTLSQILSEQEAMCTTHLKLVGPINGDDIRLLRRMAGATDAMLPNVPTGTLIHLDLTDVSLVEDNTVYYSTGAYESWGLPTGSLNLTKPISDTDWENLGKYVGYVREGFTYTRNSEGMVIKNLCALPGRISDNMFKDCISLQEILLPSGIEMIGQSAFFGCTSLLRVVFPESVSAVKMQSFTNCINLESIEAANPNIEWTKPNFENCPKSFRIP